MRVDLYCTLSTGAQSDTQYLTHSRNSLESKGICFPGDNKPTSWACVSTLKCFITRQRACRQCFLWLREGFRQHVRVGKFSTKSHFRLLLKYQDMWGHRPAFPLGTPSAEGGEWRWKSRWPLSLPLSAVPTPQTVSPLPATTVQGVLGIAGI